MVDDKAPSKSIGDQNTTTQQTSSPSMGTNDEKQSGTAGNAPSSTQGGRTTEDMVREQGGDSSDEPES